MNVTMRIAEILERESPKGFQENGCTIIAQIIVAELKLELQYRLIPIIPIRLTAIVPISRRKQSRWVTPWTEE
jgi:hypothetical protein